MQENTLAIDIQHLTYSYALGKQRQVIANDDVSLSVQQGEIFGLLGPNGAGKTTLVHQLMGLIQPQKGTIRLLDTDVIQHPAIARRHIGFLPQQGTVMRPALVRQALYFTGRLRGMSNEAARQQTHELMDALELTDVANATVGTLSGGLQRLVSFASALMGYPAILVLDEPTNALAPETRQLVWGIIQQLNRQRGATCFLITHNLLEAERVVQRVAVMQAGQIKMVGTPGEIKRQVNATVQIELWLRVSTELPSTLTHNPSLRVEQPHPSHYQITVPRTEVMATLTAITQEVGFDQLDDFRISPPSLEAVYLEQIKGNNHA